MQNGSGRWSSAALSIQITATKCSSGSANAFRSRDMKKVPGSKSKSILGSGECALCRIQSFDRHSEPRPTPGQLRENLPESGNRRRGRAQQSGNFVMAEFSKNQFQNSAHAPENDEFYKPVDPSGGLQGRLFVVTPRP